ncbi:MAG: recombinase family protein [Geminicoccaceae bacterium]
MDWIARSTSELLHIAETIQQKEAELQSLEEPWADTTSLAARMVLTIFGGIAEFERALIRSRTEEGRRAAQQKGAPSGDPLKNAP